MIAVFRGGPDFDVRGRDGLTWTVIAPKEIVLDDGRRFLVPAGSRTDGASTPKVLWSLGFPPTGDYWSAAVVHDAAYRGSLHTWNGTDWVLAERNEAFANDLMLALMVSVGVPEAKRIAIYETLKAFGFKAFAEDADCAAT
jgi:hypothetical protein